MTDGVIDIADTPFGKKLSRLAGFTVQSVHELIGEEPSFRHAAKNDLTTYMLNENVVFMQFIEGLIKAHTSSMAGAYQAVHRMDKK